MTFIRRLFQNLVSILEKFSAEDACALLCAAGMTNFELDKLLPKDEEAEETAAGQDVSLAGVLCLEAECPAWSWKSEALSASFLWKKETDLWRVLALCGATPFSVEPLVPQPIVLLQSAKR